MKNRRVIFRKFGESSELELETVDCLPPASGNVVVKMAGAGLNPIDYKTRKGLGFVAAKIADKLPWCPGFDLSGEIVETASDVTRWKIGDRVYGMVGFPLSAGAYADYVEVDAEMLCVAPSNIALKHAGGVPLAALTAWQALFAAGDLQPGSRILIHAAAGGVGHFAVQFAKAINCEVIATGSEANKDFLESLGVDQVIDYRNQDFTEVCSAMDFVLDNMGGAVGEKSLDVISLGGQMVTVPTITAQQIMEAASTKSIRAVGLTVAPSVEHLSNITKMIDTGKVLVNIDRFYSLENAKEAHNYLEKGHTRGKLMLEP